MVFSHDFPEFARGLPLDGVFKPGLGRGRQLIGKHIADKDLVGRVIYRLGEGAKSRRQFPKVLGVRIFGPLQTLSRTLAEQEMGSVHQGIRRPADNWIFHFFPPSNNPGRFRKSASRNRPQWLIIRIRFALLREWPGRPRPFPPSGGAGPFLRRQPAQGCPGDGEWLP